MEIFAISNKGLVRKNNQDYFFLSENPDLPLFIVADGMGGHKAGEIASKLAATTIRDEFIFSHLDRFDENDIKILIKEAIIKANEKIYLQSKSQEECEGMGTTTSLVYIFKKNLYIGHVGDSRLYLISEGKINQVTQDHTLVNELVKKGSITKEEGESHPKKNFITRAIGSEVNIDIDIYKRTYRENDIIILCTDGLTNLIDENNILNEFIKENSIEKASKVLVKKALDRGGYDNITLLAIRMDKDEVEIW